MTVFHPLLHELAFVGVQDAMYVTKLAYKISGQRGVWFHWLVGDHYNANGGQKWNSSDINLGLGAIYYVQWCYLYNMQGSYFQARDAKK